MIDRLIGKEVEVGIPGMTYAGTFIGMTETEVYLVTELGWISLPMGEVIFLREKGGESFTPRFEGSDLQ